MEIYEKKIGLKIFTNDSENLKNIGISKEKFMSLGYLYNYKDGNIFLYKNDEMIAYLAKKCNKLFFFPEDEDNAYKNLIINDIINVEIVSSFDILEHVSLLYLGNEKVKDNILLSLDYPDIFSLTEINNDYFEIHRNVYMSKKIGFDIPCCEMEKFKLAKYQFKIGKYKESYNLLKEIKLKSILIDVYVDILNCLLFLNYFDEYKFLIEKFIEKDNTDKISDILEYYIKVVKIEKVIELDKFISEIDVYFDEKLLCIENIKSNILLNNINYINVKNSYLIIYDNDYNKEQKVNYLQKYDKLQILDKDKVVLENLNKYEIINYKKFEKIITEGNNLKFFKHLNDIFFLRYENEKFEIINLISKNVYINFKIKNIYYTNVIDIENYLCFIIKISKNIYKMIKINKTFCEYLIGNDFYFNEDIYKIFYFNSKIHFIVKNFSRTFIKVTNLNSLK